MIGAVLGAGLGAVIRNLGGAVAAAILLLFVLPPLVVQLFTDAASWIPPTLFAVISGVSNEVSLWAALPAITAWALIPAAAGVLAARSETSCSGDPRRPCRVGGGDRVAHPANHLTSP